MAIISAGYDGTVDEIQFAQLLRRYSIVGPDDFAATNVAGDRLVSIADGTALGPGTIDMATDLGTIQFDAASSIRHDLVVLRRDWQPPGGQTSVAVIKGGTTRALPDREMNPGVLDDQPLYLQRVNGSLLGERVDLRCWAANGGLAAVDDLARTYLNQPGTSVAVGEQIWQYLPQSNGLFAWRAVNGLTSAHGPLSPSSAYSNSGVIIVSGGRREVAISINRTTAGLNVSSTEYAGLGIVIPPSARVSSDRVYYLPGWFYGSGNANYPCQYFVNMRTGEIRVRIQSGSVSFPGPVSFDINFTAFQ